MKLSILTPTHRPKYLLDTYASLQAQSYKDFEWIVAPNARKGEPLPKLPNEIVKDPRVRLLPISYEGIPKIGALKRFCCDHAQGDVFIELDHDDMLVPDVLNQIAQCAAQGGDFIYSDTALFDTKSLNPSRYSENWGWETYDFQVYGRPCVAIRNFEITPRSLCEIYYAPDHVRCWTRDAYYRAGGHNCDLEVGDDHELMCQSYLKGLRFMHTGSCGYLYRQHPHNTVKSHQQKIQQQQSRNRDQFIHLLMDEWLRRTKYGYLDLTQDPRMLKFKDGVPRIRCHDDTIGVLRAYDGVLGRIPQEHAAEMMNEIYRVLVPGGYACIETPSTNGPLAFVPEFKSLWNRHSFEYYGNKAFARRLEGVKCRFQIIRNFERHRPQESRKLNWIFCYVDMCALKGQRQPGVVLI